MATNATPTQDSMLLPAEAGFSTNLFLTHPIMGRQQFTFRGTTSTDWGIVLEDVGRFLHFMREKGWKFEGENVAPQAPEPAKQNQIQATLEDGTPVIDGNQQPVMVPLPQDVHLFTVKEVYHDTNKGGDKHMLKVVIHEQYPYSNGKYGISCFNPGPEFTGWRDWGIGQRFAPPVKAAKVLIRDPKPGGKYSDVVEFRA